jgi:hypothetical protein
MTMAMACFDSLIESSNEAYMMHRRRRLDFTLRERFSTISFAIRTGWSSSKLYKKPTFLRKPATWAYSLYSMLDRT